MEFVDLQISTLRYQMVAIDLSDVRCESSLLYQRTNPPSG